MKKLEKGDKVKVLNSNTSPFEVGDIVEFVELSNVSPSYKFSHLRGTIIWCLDVGDFEVLSKHEIGKEYEFNDREDFNKLGNRISKLAFDLGYGYEFRYVVDKNNGRYIGYRFIREVENPRIKEIETALESLEAVKVELQNEFKNLIK